jgi:hypothetical protein
VPELYLTMGYAIEVQCAISNPDKMHAAAPFT